MRCHGAGEAPRSETWLAYILEAMATPSDEHEALAGRYGVPADVAKTAHEILEARKPDVHRYLVSQAIALTPTHLVSFDYSVRLVMTSSTLHGVFYPVLVLLLLLQDANGAQREVRYEMTTDQVDDLLNEFDAIEKTLSAVAPQDVV
ncbi:hypothetical protein SPRG_10426 [Saprolegnia parasitica CBS 223.65]|uniref:COMM domain-containing protein n=1 Tax=Saprolegnia parasitica (strain CBS 223.65) TaxID=695850 RepID=A0A067C0P4_SAPPC|nr:hypothetical protein SPRG_10426 [Saprolegnia parasitica CBS 223.65]KDO24349.1 hypothetical protein SPRG_10426 [Saprolegnia parasitica CBS 223.65]|eukprot:XP_012204944.1 hypothetical protein SPRG_10426 [Saprolegnia parasitica CBS 223.65]